jgi:hypothetical protein
MARLRFFKLNEKYFENIDTPNKAYVLGFIYADGGVYKNNLSIGLNEKDYEILRFIKNELEYGGSIKTRNNVCILTITSKKIVNDLKSLGVIENKTYLSKTLPNFDNRLFPHFLRGFFDGDGSIYSNTYKNRREEFTISFSSNSFILSEIKEKLNKYNITSCKIRYRRKESIYSGQLEIRGSENIKKMYDLLFYNEYFCLQRKYDRFKKFITSYNSERIKRKNELEIDEIIKLYQQGYRQFEIAKMTNTNFSTIRGIVQKLRKKEILI